mmetsp:Transcript_28423/g.90520  ORF Transcript_28423/g.90520 Transcript_28423/m.90520 type:complete len:244 (+) Transcript_28423:804-1535(+)
MQPASRLAWITIQARGPQPRPLAAPPRTSPSQRRRRMATPRRCRWMAALLPTLVVAVPSVGVRSSQPRSYTRRGPTAGHGVQPHWWQRMKSGARFTLRRGPVAVAPLAAARHPHVPRTARPHRPSPGSLLAPLQQRKEASWRRSAMMPGLSWIKSPFRACVASAFPRTLLAVMACRCSRLRVGPQPTRRSHRSQHQGATKSMPSEIEAATRAPSTLVQDRLQRGAFPQQASSRAVFSARWSLA